jgi:[ribosomal protein S5]-alanine N-acetyltransferase
MQAKPATQCYIYAMTARASSLIQLRKPIPADQAEFLALARASGALHQPWVLAPNTPRRYTAYLSSMDGAAQCALLVCERKTRRIVGVVNITSIVLGKFCSAYVGYYVFAGFERQGFMRQGLQAAVHYAFKTLKLHRLEANIQPGNLASIALVRGCGFNKEGYSPSYLNIGGQWRDHERWAVLA